MAGKVPGTVPAAVKRRRNKDTLAPQRQGVRRGITIDQPQPSPHWRTDVRNYFNSVLASGQSDWYENSDLMMLTIQCELLDKVLRGSRLVPVFAQERDSEGNYVNIIDEDGNPVPEMDEWGEPVMRPIGNINGQALKAILDMSSELLVTEGSRRRLRIDLGMPEDDGEPIEKAIVGRQRQTVGKVASKV